MDWLQSLPRRAQVFWALTWRRKYPEKLPEPPLGRISAREATTIDGLRSVCLFLGPYRNLTSLTASVLFLHPECQVLNHAGSRILPREEWNFLVNYSDEKFRRFCHVALTLSQGGARGGHGGSVVLSHAFAEHPEMWRTYRARFGTRLLKRSVKSLVWKESEKVGEFIRKNGADLGQLVKNNPRLRFLLPIRNPLDCSLSLSRIGISKFYPQFNDNDLFPLLKTILEEIKWFVELAEEHSEHFLHYFQDEVDSHIFRRLARFLGLAEDPRWISDALNVYQLKRPYTYNADLKHYYAEMVEALFHRRPEFRDHLVKMMQHAS
ncbi:MAG: hypothetical protein WEA61_07180 [Anaerolineales bacterium]